MARRVLCYESMLDLVAIALVATLGVPLVGFGIMGAALAGPNRLVCVAMLLMMIAATNARSNDLDF